MDVQHLGSTRCKVQYPSVHQCRKADRGWPIRAAHISQFPASVTAALEASYAAFADFQQRTKGRVRPLTHAGQVIY